MSSTTSNYLSSNHCVFCNNDNYEKDSYEGLCATHRRNLLWGN